MAKFYLSRQGLNGKYYVTDKKKLDYNRDIAQADLFDSQIEIDRFIQKHPGMTWQIHRIEHL